MKILFLGDVVGRPGRLAVRALVSKLRVERGIDVVVANGENSAGGAGITTPTATELFDGGVDVITTGDHVWDQKEAIVLLQSGAPVLRPLNYPPETPGRGSLIFQKAGLPPVAVVNLQGRTFMPPLENPFLAVESEVARLREMTKIILVDIHAEATSEKIAIARFLDGKVTAVVGTHTHVQTADEQIFPGGTGFLCDAGFTGPHESILGREIEPVVRRFLTSQPRRFDVATGRVLLQGVVITLAPESGRALGLERISELVEIA